MTTAGHLHSPVVTSWPAAIDHLGRVRKSLYLRWVQDAAVHLSGASNLKMPPKLVSGSRSGMRSTGNHEQLVPMPCVPSQTRIFDGDAFSRRRSCRRMSDADQALTSCRTWRSLTT